MTEGNFGDLVTYVVPQVSPKTCQSITHQLKTLSLHLRVQEAELEGDQVIYQTTLALASTADLLGIGLLVIVAADE